MFFLNSKLHMRKKLWTKKWWRNWVFNFYYCEQKFSAYNFLGWTIFCPFFKGFKLNIKFFFLSFMMFTLNLWKKNIFAHIRTLNWEAKRAWKGSKSYIRIPSCIHIRSGEGLFIQKGQNHYTLCTAWRKLFYIKCRKNNSRESHTRLCSLPGNCITQPPPGQLIHAEFTTSLTTFVVFLLSVSEVVVLPA